VAVDNSTDGTGEIARRAGAEVHDKEDLMPELGPVPGKGDAIWPLRIGDAVFPDGEGRVTELLYAVAIDRPPHVSLDAAA
jgi:hypothetical protein